MMQRGKMLEFPLEYNECKDVSAVRFMVWSLRVINY